MQKHKLQIHRRWSIFNLPKFSVYCWASFKQNVSIQMYQITRAVHALRERQKMNKNIVFLTKKMITKRSSTLTVTTCLQNVEAKFKRTFCFVVEKSQQQSASSAALCFRFSCKEILLYILLWSSLIQFLWYEFLSCVCACRQNATGENILFVPFVGSPQIGSLLQHRLGLKFEKCMRNENAEYNTAKFNSIWTRKERF